MDAWDYEQSLDKLGYQPKDNHWLEIWQYEGTRGTEIRDGVIEKGDRKALKSWLEKRGNDSDHGDVLIGGLRLLFSYVDPDQDDIPRKPVLWKRDDFEEIMRALCLPKRYAHMLSTEHTMLAAFHPDDAAGRFGYIFSTFFHHHPFWSLAASYDQTTQTTAALLHCSSDLEEESVERLVRYLKSTAPLVLHPLLLPIIIMDLETSLSLRDCQQWRAELGALEEVTGQNPMDLNSSESWQSQKNDPLDLDLGLLMRRMNACSVFMRLIQRECEGVLEQLAQVREALASSNTWWQGSPTGSPFERDVERRLKAHIDFLLTSRKILLIRLNEVQQGTQTQLAVVYSFIAQRNNESNIGLPGDSKSPAVASKRNSFSIKTIALSTMMILSGTFLASFLVPSFLDWQNSSSEMTPRPNFWVYWATTVPFTLIVLGVWEVWIRPLIPR